MFDSLSERLASTVKKLQGQARLTDDNIRETLREVRMALLEADVALPVVKVFIARLQDRAIGKEVMNSLTPGQEFVRVVNEELTQVMGQANEGLDLEDKNPAIILMAGLQGAGKTTSVAKLARFIKEKTDKRVMVVSADVHRPAAIAQLETLAKEVGVRFYPSDSSYDPVDISEEAVAAARLQRMDVLLVDTAGRLHIDDAMMDEIKRINAAIMPDETLFVVDSMTGQDAANAARAFNNALPLTGVILTKADGDARGGAALSVRQITGKPIKFLGVGEKTTALEAFHPERIASRILGMGDVLSLVEDVQEQVDQKQAAKLANKIRKGRGFDMSDLQGQLVQMQKMGGIASMMDKLPGNIGIPDQVKKQAADGKQFDRMIAIINSMTPQERRFPDIIKGSRKRRIAKGSGAQIQEVNRLLKQHMQMKKMMKKFKGGGMRKMMRAMKGQMPPGMPF